MDPKEYTEIVKYKLRNEYPENLSKRDKFIIRRKASLYVIEGKSTPLHTPDKEVIDCH